uniref:Uncharacterized protein n=1 Tax=Arundo donax TaxID=35708 RepID=A0A0A9AJY8_ARUDO
MPRLELKLNLCEQVHVIMKHISSCSSLQNEDVKCATCGSLCIMDSIVGKKRAR